LNFLVCHRDGSGCCAICEYPLPSERILSRAFLSRGPGKGMKKPRWYGASKNEVLKDNPGQARLA
jgi:hypothetical protein